MLCDGRCLEHGLFSLVFWRSTHLSLSSASSPRPWAGDGGIAGPPSGAPAPPIDRPFAVPGRDCDDQVHAEVRTIRDKANPFYARSFAGPEQPTPSRYGGAWMSTPGQHCAAGGAMLGTWST